MGSSTPVSLRLKWLTGTGLSIGFTNARRPLKNLRTQLTELIEIMRREGASERQVMRLRLHRAILMTKVALKEALISVGMLSRKYEGRPFPLPRPSTR